MKKTLTCLALMMLCSLPLCAQQPYTRMTDAELQTFLHDLGHGLQVWQSRIGQYQSDLHLPHAKDMEVNFFLKGSNKLMADAIERTDSFARQQSLTNMVKLQLSVERLVLVMDEFATTVRSASLGKTGVDASQPLISHAQAWQQSIVDAEKELLPYIEKFRSHLLSNTESIDQSLAQNSSRTSRPLPSDSPPAEAWKDRSRWRTLRKGMSKDDVRSLFGEPTKIDAGSTLDFWYYGIYPNGGQVDFDPQGRVEGWREP